MNSRSAVTNGSGHAVIKVNAGFASGAASLEVNIDRATLDGSHGRVKAFASAANFLINPAHAGWFGWSSDDFFDGLSAIASLALPINEIKAIWTQLGYLATDPTKFDGMDLVINVISMATYFPVLKPLTPIVRPAKVLFTKIKRIGNPKFAQALGGVMGTAFEQLYKDGRGDKLLSLVPFLLIAYEMRDSWEAVEVMVEGIESPDDLWGWIEYFNLPADGWEGEGAPPPLDLALAPISDANTRFAGLEWLLSPAHAASPFKGFRMKGDVVGKAIKKAFEGLGKDFDPKDYTGSVKAFTRGLTSAQGLRTLATNPATMRATYQMYKSSKKNLTNFMAGRSSTRVPAPLIIAMVAYIQSETLEGGKLADPKLQREIQLLYAGMFADILSGKTLKEEDGEIVFDSNTNPAFFPESAAAVLRPSAHGASFQLAMVAYQTLRGYLKDIEAERMVFSFNDQDKFDKSNFIESKRAYHRMVDIVLFDEEGQTPGSTSQDETWVELKSWQHYRDGNKLSKKAVAVDGLMTMGGKPVARAGLGGNLKKEQYQKSTANRQFNVDRMATKVPVVYHDWVRKAFWEKDVNKDIIKDGNVNVSELQWWFQEFDVKQRTVKGVEIKAAASPTLGSVGEDGTICERLTELPFHKSYGMEKAAVQISFGVKDRASDPKRSAYCNNIKLFTTVELLIEELKRNDLLDSTLEELLQ